MNMKEIKEMYERDLKYREKGMMESIAEMIQRADMLKEELTKAQTRMDKNKNNFGGQYEFILDELKSFALKFTNSSLQHNYKEWDKTHEVLKAINHLEEGKEEGKVKILEVLEQCGINQDSDADYYNGVIYALWKTGIFNVGEKVRWEDEIQLRLLQENKTEEDKI